MNFTLKKISSPRDFEWEWAMSLYQDSFPSCERRDRFSAENILKESNFSFFVIYEAGRLVGLLSCWEWESWCYIEHFATHPSFRGQGIGAAVLKQFFAGKNKCKIIWEIEPVGSSSLALRRLEFYKRCGGVVHSFYHIQPPYNVGEQGVLLTIMTYGDDVSEFDYREWYGEYLRRIFKKNIATI